MTRLATALRRHLLLTIAAVLVVGIAAGYVIAHQRQATVLDACQRAVRALEELQPPEKASPKPGGLVNMGTVDGEIECLGD
jgi:hypothetical protein